MLKSQDCMVLLKLLANPGLKWSQRQLAQTLYISLAEVNAAIKRLIEAGLLRKDKQLQFVPVISAAEEFLVNGLKYLFPGKLGEYTRGIPTGVAAPFFHNKIALGNDPVPIWPDALGEKKGVALKPIHPSIPKVICLCYYSFHACTDANRVRLDRYDFDLSVVFFQYHQFFHSTVLH